MADKLFFSRDTKVFITYTSATGNLNKAWSVPVLDGFSFSQSTNTSEITLNEMANASGVSRRGRQMFTDSYAPAEWSFSTYVRPFVSAGSPALDNGVAGAASTTHAVEEVLWANFLGAGTYDATANDFAEFTHGNAGAGLDITFANSNFAKLGTFDLIFMLGSGSTYRIKSCCVNEASLDFDIDGIATINWSGMGSIIEDIEDLIVRANDAPNAQTSPSTGLGSLWVDSNSAGKYLFIAQAASGNANWERAIDEGSTSANTSNFIRNRLTSLAVTNATGGSFQSSYDVVLTGGNVTFSNNMTYLTPETLGVVNQPLGHVTGTRSVSGSFTCYLGADTGSAVDSSSDLFEDIIESTDSITNQFGLAFSVGGASAAPGLVVTVPKAHLEVPTHSLDDVISLEVNFHGLPTDINTPDEATIKYKGTTL
tara:strand:+ start:2427 stop:3701 length:1275 start_codon:yes stop_codon:yes gene_type:complete